MKKIKTTIVFLLIICLLISFYACKTKKEDQPVGKQESQPVPEGMVKVEGGEFKMGSKEGWGDEKPVHKVKVNSFYIGKYETTVKEFGEFIKATRYKTDADKGGFSYKWKGSELVKCEGVNWQSDVNGLKRKESENNEPVIHVSWKDAVAYCEWRSKKEGKSYRLPTEAEWEYAARGGNKSEGYMYSGSYKINEVAWYGDKEGKTHQVGTKKANELGIFDMSGNILEWCNDWYGVEYYGESPLENPKGALSGECRVLRGGSWLSIDYRCRVASRSWNYPEDRNFNYGFRLVQDL